MAPELGSQFLDLFEMDRRRLQSRTAGAALMMDDESNVLEEIVVTAQAKVDVGGFAVNYDIPGPYQCDE